MSFKQLHSRLKYTRQCRQTLAVAVRRVRCRHGVTHLSGRNKATSVSDRRPSTPWVLSSTGKLIWYLHGSRDAMIPFFQIRSDPIQKILSIADSDPILAQFFLIFFINVEFLYFCVTLLCVKHNLLDNFILMKNNMKIYIGAVYIWSLHEFCNINPIAQNTSGGGLGRIPDELDVCKCIWLLKPHKWILLLPKCKHNKRVRPCYKKDADGQHTIIFINSIRQAYLSSADAARSPIAVFDLEMSW